MTIGDRIKKEREKKNINQTDLAKAISVSKQTLYKYENNIITNIPSDKIEKISEILDITPAYIMGWEEDYYLGENLQHIFDVLSQEFGVTTNALIQCFFSEDFSDLLPSKRIISLDNMRNALKKYFENHSVKELLSIQEKALIAKYRDLDPHGRDMVDTVLEKEHSRCQTEDNVIELSSRKENLLNAAHERTDIEVTEEMKKHDDDIMDNDDLWK